MSLLLVHRMVARSADADADFANEFLQEAQEEAAKVNASICC